MDFREGGEVLFRRKKFAHDFCAGAEIPFVLMGFFNSQSRAFSDTWVGRRDTLSKERSHSIVKTAEAKLAVWAALKSQEQTDAKSVDRPETAIRTLTWINADDYVIGIGRPINGIFPVLAVTHGTHHETPMRNLLVRMGIAFVAQQLTEEMYERSFWMESMVESATQVLSIQFMVVTGEGEIQFDSRQKQKQKQKQKRPIWLARNGRLSLPYTEEKSELQDAIRDATSFEKRTSIVSLFASPGVARLVVVTPMALSDTNLALIMFENDRTDHYKLREHFFNAYKLTRSESMIAHEILSGRSIAEAAETKRLSPATVRSYMKQVLGKTGTHKQSELISLYFSSILPVNSNLEAIE